jgi:hypothetical protein
MSVANTGRRRFLSFCTGVLAAGVGLLAALPAVAYLCGPLTDSSLTGATLTRPAVAQHGQ